MQHRTFRQPSLLVEPSDSHLSRDQSILNPREFGEGMKFLPLVYCSGIAVNKVHDWSGIHHQFSEQSFGARQVYCAVCGPNPGLQVCNKCLDINGSRTVANEDN